MASTPIDEIVDFEQGFDLIDLSGFGLIGFGDLSISEVGGNSVIQIDGDDQINVIGITGMDGNDFIF